MYSILGIVLRVVYCIPDPQKSELVIVRNSIFHTGDCFQTGFELYSSGAELPAFSISKLAEEFLNWFRTGSSLKDCFHTG